MVLLNRSHTLPLQMQFEQINAASNSRRSRQIALIALG